MKKYVDVETQEFVDFDETPDREQLVPFSETVELWDVEKKKPVFVDYQKADKGISEDVYLPIEGNSYDVHTNFSDLQNVDHKTMYDMVKNNGFKFVSPIEAAKIYNENKYGSDNFSSFAQGAASGATMGLSDVGLKYAGQELDIEGLKEGAMEGRKEANPYPYYSGLIAGSILTPLNKFLPSAGITKLLGKASGETAKKIAGSRLTNFASTVIGGGLDTATTVAVNDFADKALNDARESSISDNIASEIVNSAFTGLGQFTEGALFSVPFAVPSAYLKGKQTSAIKLLEKDKKLDDIYSAEQAGVFSDDGKVFISDPNIDIKAVQPSRIKGGDGLFVYPFKRDANLTDENIFTFNDGNTIVDIDVSKLSDKLKKPNTKMFDDAVGIKNISNLMPEGEVLKATPHIETYYQLKSNQFPEDVYKVLDLDPATKNLAKKMRDAEDFVNDTLMDLPAENLSPEVRNDMLRMSKKVLDDAKTELFSAKPTNDLVKQQVKKIKGVYNTSKNNSKKIIQKLTTDTIGHVDGDGVYIYDISKIPEDAIVESARIYNPKSVPSRLGDKMEAGLRWFGGTSNQIKGFVSKFAKKEDREFANNYIANLFKQNKRGFGLLAPKAEDIQEILANDLSKAHVTRNDALNNLATIAEGGRPTPMRGLNGKVLANKLRQKIENRFIDPETGLPGLQTQTMKFIDDMADTLDSAHGYDMTPKEWIGLREKLDNMIKYGSANNVLTPKDQMLFSLRDEMEDMLAYKVKTYYPEKGSPFLKQYEDSKKIMRLTDPNYDDSLAKMLERKISLNRGRQTIQRTDSIMAAPVIGGGYAAGGVGGAALGLGAMASRQAINNNQAYYQYKFLDALEKSAANQNSGLNKAAQFFVRANKGAVIQADKFLIDEKSGDWFERNFDAIADELTDPSVFINKFLQANPEISERDPELAMKLAEKTYRAQAFLADKMPRSPYPRWQDVKWKPSVLEQRKWLRYASAVNNLNHVFENISNGVVSPEEIEVLQNVYPETLLDIQKSIHNQMRGKPLDMEQRTMYKKLFGKDYSLIPPEQTPVTEENPQQKTRKMNKGFSLQGQTENERLLNK